jgi:hypothetical protein
MSTALARALIVLATCWLPRGRSEWAQAMRAEFAVAMEEGAPLAFAAGCLLASVRELLTREEGCFAITSHALAVTVMLPMAALQVGCALFGLPYLFPGHHGLAGALTEGGAYLHLMQRVYQAAVPSLDLLLLLIGMGHLRVAWAMLDGDWAGVARLGWMTLASSVTLVLLMTVLFLHTGQALLLGAILLVELSSVLLVARWHRQLHAAPG